LVLVISSSMLNLRFIAFRGTTLLLVNEAVS
jgi:hypothetical protein